MTKTQMFFDDGFKEIEINGDPNRVFRWNPQDLNMFDKFYGLVNWASLELPKITDGLSEGLRNVHLDEDGELNIEGYDLGDITKRGEIINHKLDSVFGAGASKAAFAGANPLTPTMDGVLFSNFLVAITPIIEAGFAEAGVKADEMVAKKNEYGAKAHLQKKRTAQTKRG